MPAKAKYFFQPVIWTIALALLYSLDRATTNGTICIFSLAGFENCPGCGIGHAISEALHLNFFKSYETHVMGIPATIILILHIIRTIISSIKQAIHGPETTYDVTGPST